MVRWADHAAADRAYLQSEGIYTKPAHKSVADGINSVAQRLMINRKTGKPRLQVLIRVKASLRSFKTTLGTKAIVRCRIKNLPSNRR